MAYYNSYGNYGGYGYPYGNQYPVYPQAMQSAQPTQPQQTVQNYSPVINQNGIIWISGIQEAQMYPIAPNNAVALWEKSGKTIYLKQADATGRPSLTIYDLVERTETASDGVSPSEDKLQAYATKEELSAIIGAVKGIASEVETMKSDMYGIAGKKKAVKKVEVEEDA